jgi:thiol:disulfide interchange protein/DsbC/DsbD-like thiol-disulfide interchange protein
VAQSQTQKMIQTFPEIWHLILMRYVRILLLTLFCLASLTAHAAHTQVTLLLSDDTAKPGDTVWAGVDLKMDPDWHTYWKNSGDAGLPTTIAWQLPTGVTAGDILWPLPEKLPPIEVTTYGYNDEVILLVPLKIAANVPAGPITLTANVAWLECKDACVPGKATVQTTLNIGSETKPSANVATIESWRTKVPPPAQDFTIHAWWETQTTNDTRPLMIQGYTITNKAIIDSGDFFPDATSDNYEIQPATENLLSQTPGFEIRKYVKKFSGNWPSQISGVMVITRNGQRQGYSIQIPISDSPMAGTPEATPTQVKSTPTKTNAAVASASNSSSPNAATPPAKSLASYLLSAFIGGLILNIMPCVLPVIALKILGFVSEANSDPRRVRNLGFIYALGVLVSFSVIAAVVIGFKAVGKHVGWGMQFGSPVFVVGLITIVTLTALNLFGVFEITPGGKVMNVAGNLASRHGAAGAFFNGLLATILATPCTAPFFGPALAFAFSQSAIVIFLILFFAGLGLASPYVLLSCNPALLKFMPKPGAWMEKFKIIIGFPMLATAVWLFDVASSVYGSRVFWLGIFLVILACAAWIFGEFVQRGRNGKGIAIVAILILLIGGYAYALEDRLDWRSMNTGKDATTSLIDNSANGNVWTPWSSEAVAQARAVGKPVLVDFTATWCVTCNAIVKPALENPSVVAKLKELDATTLLGDYTRTPQPMTEEISKYGAAGVPLVLVFPKNPEAPAIVLRQPNPLEFPSSYSKAVLAALEEASK